MPLDMSIKKRFTAAVVKLLSDDSVADNQNSVISDTDIVLKELEPKPHVSLGSIIITANPPQVAKQFVKSLSYLCSDIRCEELIDIWKDDRIYIFPDKLGDLLSKLEEYNVSVQKGKSNTELMSKELEFQLITQILDLIFEEVSGEGIARVGDIELYNNNTPGLRKKSLFGRSLYANYITKTVEGTDGIWSIEYKGHRLYLYMDEYDYCFMSLDKGGPENEEANSKKNEIIFSVSEDGVLAKIPEVAELIVFEDDPIYEVVMKAHKVGYFSDEDKQKLSQSKLLNGHIPKYTSLNTFEEVRKLCGAILHDIRQRPEPAVAVPQKTPVLMQACDSGIRSPPQRSVTPAPVIEPSIKQIKHMMAAILYSHLDDDGVVFSDGSRLIKAREDYYCYYYKGTRADKIGQDEPIKFNRLQGLHKTTPEVYTRLRDQIMEYTKTEHKAFKKRANYARQSLPKWIGVFTTRFVLGLTSIIAGAALLASGLFLVGTPLMVCGFVVSFVGVGAGINSVIKHSAMNIFSKATFAYDMACSRDGITKASETVAPVTHAGKSSTTSTASILQGLGVVGAILNPLSGLSGCSSERQGASCGNLCLLGDKNVTLGLD